MDNNPYNPSSGSSANYYQSVFYNTAATNGTTLTFGANALAPPYPTIIGAYPAVVPSASKPEDPIEWLHRRVREIEWREAA